MSLRISIEKLMKLSQVPQPTVRQLGIACFVFCLSACTKDITINLPSQEPKIVVEGHIESGLPPYVILSKSSDYYSTFYLDSIDNYFIHGAIVRVSDGSDTVTLSEISFDTAGTTVSVYTSLGMVGQEEKTYSLWVEAE